MNALSLPKRPMPPLSPTLELKDVVLAETDINRMLTTLPFFVQVLRLARMKLDAVPAAVCDLVSLITLTLEGHNITNLPEKLAQLTALQHLALNDNYIVQFPSSLCVTSSLKRLVLSSNKLAWLPEEISSLKNLEVLTVDNNNLSSLPEGLSGLCALQKFEANSNALSSLPLNLTKLTCLCSISINENKLKSFPVFLLSIPSLEELHLAKNQVEEWDGTIRRGTTLSNTPAALKVLDLSFNGMGRINLSGPVCDGLGNVTKLKLRGNRLTSLPSSLLTSITKVQELDISLNDITELPSTFYALTSLTSLNADANGLTASEFKRDSLPNLRTYSMADVARLSPRGDTSPRLSTVRGIGSVSSTLRNESPRWKRGDTTRSRPSSYRRPANATDNASDASAEPQQLPRPVTVKFNEVVVPPLSFPDGSAIGSPSSLSPAEDEISIGGRRKTELQPEVSFRRLSNIPPIEKWRDGLSSLLKSLNYTREEHDHILNLPEPVGWTFMKTRSLHMAFNGPNDEPEYFSSRFLFGRVLEADMSRFKEQLKISHPEWMKRFIESEGIFALFTFLQAITKDKNLYMVVECLECTEYLLGNSVKYSLFLVFLRFSLV